MGVAKVWAYYYGCDSEVSRSKRGRSCLLCRFYTSLNRSCARLVSGNSTRTWVDPTFGRIKKKKFLRMGTKILAPLAQQQLHWTCQNYREILASARRGHFIINDTPLDGRVPFLVAWDMTDQPETNTYNISPWFTSLLLQGAHYYHEEQKWGSTWF